MKLGRKFTQTIFPGQAHVVVHGAVVVAEDAVGDGDAPPGHFAEGPLPDVIFFEAAAAVAAKANGVVADFVEEDGGGDGAAWTRGGDKALDAAVVVEEFIGHAGHVAAPFADRDLVGFLGIADQPAIRGGRNLSGGLAQGRGNAAADERRHGEQTAGLRGDRSRLGVSVNLRNMFHTRT